MSANNEDLQRCLCELSKHFLCQGCLQFKLNMCRMLRHKLRPGKCFKHKTKTLYNIDICRTLTEKT